MSEKYKPADYTKLRSLRKDSANERGRDVPVVLDLAPAERSTTRYLWDAFSSNSLGAIYRHGPIPERGVLTLSLSDFCTLVDVNSTLQTAQILSTCCHTQHSAFVIHRFLTVQLRASGGRSAWLRLDRRPKGGLLGVSRGIGKTPANDTVNRDTTTYLVPRGLLSHRRYN